MQCLRLNMLASLILAALTSLILFLPALAVGKQVESSNGNDSNGFPPKLMEKSGEMVTDFRDVGDIPIVILSPSDTTWHPFLFTNAGSYGNLRFQVTGILLGSTWQFTDYYCAGDRFQVFVTDPLNNNITFTSSLPGATSCANHTTDPNVANLDPEATWSRTSGIFILPGTYTFTFYTLASPFSAGKAAFRLNGLL